MRSLITSSSIMLLLLILWFSFFSFSGNTLASFADSADITIMYSVNSGNWDKAITDFSHLETKWNKYRQIANFFLSSSELNEIDFTLARAKHYIYAESADDAGSELAHLSKQLQFLYNNESVTLGNVL